MQKLKIPRGGRYDNVLRVAEDVMGSYGTQGADIETLILAFDLKCQAIAL